MSLVQLNIRTRIELETRVLAAALKQSFERGDADGVSLAHRQLFLLLKDQKAGNGATSQEGAEEANGDAVKSEAVEPVGMGEMPAPVHQSPEPNQLEAPPSYREAAPVEQFEPAVHQYQQYKQSREQGQNQELPEAPRNQPAAEEEDYTAMRKPDPPKKAMLPFNVPSPEYAEIFGEGPGLEAQQQHQQTSEAGQMPEQLEASEYLEESPEYVEQYEEELPDYSQQQFEAHSIPAYDPEAEYSLPPETPFAPLPPPSQDETQAIPPYASWQLDAQGTLTVGLSPRQESVPQPDAALQQSDSQQMAAYSAASQTDSQQMAAYSAASQSDSQQMAAHPYLQTDAYSDPSQSDSQKIRAFSLPQSAPHSQDPADFTHPTLAQESTDEASEGLSAPTDGGFIDAEFADQSHYLEAESDAPDSDPQFTSGDFAIVDNQSETAEIPSIATGIDLVLSSLTPAQDDEQTEPYALDADSEELESEQPELEVEAPAIDTSPQEVAAVAEVMEELPPPAPPRVDLYELLGVSQMSPFEEIHKNFLRRIRKILLKLRGAVRPEKDELLKELRKNWIARDILCDPVTRTDYDFRDMGLRGSPDAMIPHAPEDGPQGRIGQRTPLRIGELLQCAGLLEQAELEIACDMHKAMPEMQFGTFLVRQGFIQERDLESVLLGQKLLRDGNITVAQFQVAMELSQSRGTNISDILIDHGYITEAQLAILMGEPEISEDGSAPDAVPQIREVPIKPRQEQPPPPPPRADLSVSSAVPTWKDQLDWSKPLVVDDESTADRDPEKQSLAELLGNVQLEVPEQVAPEEPEVRKISNNAAPSWKDQLDWEKPEEPVVEEVVAEEPSVPEPELPQANIDLSNAVPSWRDQLDWEAPKTEETQETAPPPEPTPRSRRETQAMPAIRPNSSQAPYVTLGTGAGQEQASPEFFKHVNAPSQAMTEGQVAPSAETAEIQQASETDADEESDELDADETDTGEHPTEEGTEQEGFFKKRFGKFRRTISDGVKKDKKKKRK